MQPSPTSIRSLHREMFRLLVLCAAVVGIFIATRVWAEARREAQRLEAGVWFERGGAALDSGNLPLAIDNFRRATAKNREAVEYKLALAQALAAQGRRPAARAELLALRETSPDDPRVNLPLARLAAADGDIDAAIRFYHNALYAPWTASDAQPRTAARLELIDLLFAHGQKERALSELLALSGDMPGSAWAHIQVGSRLLRAGVLQQALTQFRQALALDPGNAEALAGAGRVAYQRGDYVLARDYLRSITVASPELASLRETVEFVIDDNPWAPRIGAAERSRRLRDNLAYVRDRVATCAQQPDADAVRKAAPGLEARAKAFERPLRTGADADTIEDAVSLTGDYATLAATTPACGQATPREEALRLIASRESGRS